MVAGSPKLASASAQRAGPRPVGREPLCLDEVLSIARGELRVELDPDPALRARLERSRAVVEAIEARGGAIYGVTTGVGASVGVEIPAERRAELPLQLLRFHGVGTGARLDEREAAAVLAIRLGSLARGHSGVSVALLERLAELLNLRLLPCIPEEGSVGASGDLTPLSYLAALVVGEREALHAGEVGPAAELLGRLRLEPLVLGPKESLSLMNGTAVMTAIACLALERAERIARLAAALTALFVDVTHGNRGHFDARIFDWKPHPGMLRAARWIRDDLALEPGASAPVPARLQDRYSLRCAPHVIGVLVEALDAARRTLEIEIAGVDDNPLVDPERGDVLHGGNFYGGHVCFAMDGLKAAVASVADLLDRQLALVCAPETSGGLPANLVASGDVAQHGFKAVQIATSALAAEAAKLSMPAAVFSRSTESHNQDKVSMGTIAARDCRRIVELTETVAVMALLAACQAVDLREGGSGIRAARELHPAVRKAVPMLGADRRQDLDVARLLAMLREDALPLGSGG